LRSKVSSVYVGKGPPLTFCAELTQEDRDAVEHMDIDADHTADDVEAVSGMVPPGEEGFDISHEGGEYEVFDDLVEGLAQASG
jgi:hypothetical protein